MKALTILFIFFIANISAFAGNENSQAGANSAGMAHASSTLKDIWSSYNNQAGTAYLEKINVGLYNEYRYGVSENSYNAFAIALPVKKIGVFSLSTSYYGYKQYNEQKIGLSYARKFGENISAAIQCDYLAANMGDEYYGNKSSFAVEVGFRAMLDPKLALGFHIYNLTRSKMSEYDDERIPTIIKLGLSYKFNDKVILAAESEKNIDTKNILRFGLEYKIAKPLFLRTGISSNYTTAYFGFGLLWKKLHIDFAASYHQVLGFTPHTSIQFEF